MRLRLTVPPDHLQAAAAALRGPLGKSPSAVLSLLRRGEHLLLADGPAADTALGTLRALPGAVVEVIATPVEGEVLAVGERQPLPAPPPPRLVKVSGGERLLPRPLTQQERQDRLVAASAALAEAARRKAALDLLVRPEKERIAELERAARLAAGEVAAGEIQQLLPVEGLVELGQEPSRDRYTLRRVDTGEALDLGEGQTSRAATPEESSRARQGVLL